MILRHSFPDRLLVSATGIVIISTILVGRLGSEFIPQLDEGDIAMHAMRIPGTSLSQSVDMQTKVESEIMGIPEVSSVFSKIGTAEVASDPMPPNVADTFVMLKPKSEWPDPSRSKSDVVDSISSYVSDLAGNNYEFTQPIQMRFNELISGVRSDVAIKIFGDDQNLLLSLANQALGQLSNISGVADAKVEQVTGLPVLTIKINRSRIARLGLNISDVQETVSIALGGKVVGKIYQGDRRFNILVKLPEELRQDIDTIRELPIALPAQMSEEQKRELPSLKSARFVPLSSIAEIELSTGPNQISRENGKRRIVVTANVRGRDLGSFVSEAQSKMKQNIKLPSGYWTEWGGQFEQLISASKTLKIVVPIALTLILALLFISFGNIADSLIVFTGVPLALTGGVFALWIRGIPLSISAAVGFIALSGVAVLNGLVIITFINRIMESKSISIEDAVRQGAISRLRPVLMTALVASLGFIPMALATGTGAEVQKPLATVVIGGIISSTLLTLLVLPVLYQAFHKRKFDQN